MKNKVSLLIVMTLLASAILSGVLVAPQPVAAFTRSWQADCTGVSRSQRGLSLL